ncbi:MAG: DUF2202 domain-containing protein [Actinobacteria bacterium]|nr:DUF2202 domain-containing protein [Actinomycetota bacterium]
MQHTNALLIAAGSVAAAGLLAIAAVSYAGGTDHGGRGNGGGGNGGGGRDTTRNTTVTTDAPTASTTPAASLDQTTEDALLHMVEEEKLAHDVYVTLGDVTGLTMFDRISGSEIRHESAVQTLLDQYDIADPTDGNGVGEFTDPAFTALYDQLVEQGSESDDAAFQVGVIIEELDIADLNDRLEEGTPTDVAQVFERLLAGSEKHLAAFNRMLAN